jgi:hypothetical protein
MSRYCDLLTLREYLASSNAIGTQDDGLLQSCLDRAESAIDSYTRRNFAGTAGTALYNRYSQGQVVNSALYLDRDLHTLTALTNGDGQTIPVGSTWLEPRNQAPPYRIVRLRSSYVYTWNTDSDVIVSGTFGFSTVAPADIQQATLRYATHLYRQKDASGPDNTAGFPEGGEVQYPQGMPSDVRWLLSPYRSRSGGAV